MTSPQNQPNKIGDPTEHGGVVADEHRHIVVLIILGGFFIIFTAPYLVDSLAVIAGIQNWEEVMPRDWTRIWSLLVYSLMGFAMRPFVISMREHRLKKKKIKLLRAQRKKAILAETVENKKTRLAAELKRLRSKL